MILNNDFLNVDKRSQQMLNLDEGEQVLVNFVLDDGKVMNYPDTKDYDFRKFNELGALAIEFVDRPVKPAYQSYLMKFLKDTLPILRETNFKSAELDPNDNHSFLGKIQNSSANPIVNLLISLCHYLETCKERCIVC